MAATRGRRRRPRKAAENISAFAGIRKAILGILHGAHQEPQHPQSVLCGGGRVFEVVRGTEARPRARAADPRRGLYRKFLDAVSLEANREAAFGRDSDALRLARHRAGDSLEPRSFRPRSTAQRKERKNV